MIRAQIIKYLQSKVPYTLFRSPLDSRQISKGTKQRKMKYFFILAITYVERGREAVTVSSEVEEAL